MKHLYPFIFILLFFASCKGQTTESFDYGQVNNSVYSNNFFDFTLPVPKGWFIQNEEQKKTMSLEGEKLLAGEDKNMKAILKASQVTSANLFTAFQYEKGAPVDYNPGIAIIAENITTSPGIKTGKDYLFHTRKMMEKTQINYEFNPDIQSVSIGGREFHTLDVATKLGATVINQVYYTTVTNGFALSFVTAYSGNEQKAAMAKIVSTIKFNK